MQSFINLCKSRFAMWQKNRKSTSRVDEQAQCWIPVMQLDYLQTPWKTQSNEPDRVTTYVKPKCHFLTSQLKDTVENRS